METAAQKIITIRTDRRLFSHQLWGKKRTHSIDSVLMTISEQYIAKGKHLKQQIFQTITTKTSRRFSIIKARASAQSWTYKSINF